MFHIFRLSSCAGRVTKSGNGKSMELSVVSREELLEYLTTEDILEIIKLKCVESKDFCLDMKRAIADIEAPLS